MPVIIGLMARQMPAQSLVRRLALSVLALFGLNAALLTCLVVFGLPADARVVASCYLVLGALAPSGRVSTGRRPVATTSDWWSLGAALTTFALFYRPFVGASLGRTMAQLSFSTDGANHLGLVIRTLQQGGYLPLSDYPPAWSGNVALLVELAVGSSPTPADFLSVAVPAVIGFYALLVFFGVALTLDVIHHVAGRTSRLSAFAALACAALSLLVGASNLLLRSGSYTQILSMTALLAIALLLVDSRTAPWRLTVTVALFSVAMMQTWYLLAPVLAVLVLLYLVMLRPGRLAVVAAGVPTALLSVYPLSKGPAPVAQLTALGFTDLPHMFSVFTLLLLTLGGVAVLLRRNRRGAAQPLVLVTLVVATLLSTVLVIGIQESAGSGLGYYGAKMLLVVILFGALVCAAAAGVETARAQRLEIAGTPDRLFSLLVVVLIAGGLTGTAVSTRSLTYSYVIGKASTTLDGAVLDAIFRAHPTGLPADTDAWVVDGCERGADHIANKWTHDLLLTWNDSRRATNNLYRSGRGDDVSMLLARAAQPEVARMEIYVHEECNRTAVNALAALPNVTIIRVP